jgi:hypothetical protein
VLVLGCHGGMVDQNTIRVLTSFCIIFLTFDPYFKQVTSDSFEGDTMMIICAIALSNTIKRVLFLLVDLVSGHR